MPTLSLEQMGVPVPCPAFFLPENEWEIICRSSVSQPVAQFGLPLAFSLPLICRAEDAPAAQPLAIIMWGNSERFRSFS